ncbi:HprK-related kinase B [Thiomicrorhabdus indica]|uniref:HprK-related kinase B n=1 Tax=Thiomicrorhabdus indica TaxID=2267253 RepID=UPI00102D6C91|nr:HprK-related kinase B [Thiomicrorhabdus indica]
MLSKIFKRLKTLWNNDWMTSNPNIQKKLTKLICETKGSATQSLYFELPNACYHLKTNSEALMAELARYFGKLVTQTPTNRVHQTFELNETQQQLELIEQIPWVDWTREAGKSGRKDAIFDLDYQGQTVRLLHKVKTDMLFVQPAIGKTNDHQPPAMAFGPAESHPNQIINFILTQYLNQHLRQNWLLGHAAALQINNKGIAVAGLSGGGKSTLMLHLLESGQHFISNDRVLISPNITGRLTLRGIPKQPRINPGTIVHNPRLHSLMSDAQRQVFLALPTEELRALEHKFDAPVDEIFWENCYQPETTLDAMIILNWKPVTKEPTQLKITSLTESPYLLPALMKSPGPFYSDAHGNFLKNGVIPTESDYLKYLSKVPVLELNGKVDFSKAKQLVLQAIETL